MSSYILFRVFKGIVVIVLISILTFVIMRAMPGDPVQLFLGSGEVELTQEQMDAIRAKWGLDKPFYQQYFLWAGNLLRGDLGNFYHSARCSRQPDDSGSYSYYGSA